MRTWSVVADANRYGWEVVAPTGARMPHYTAPQHAIERACQLAREHRDVFQETATVDVHNAAGLIDMTIMYHGTEG